MIVAMVCKLLAELVMDAATRRQSSLQREIDRHLPRRRGIALRTSRKAP